MKDEKKKNKKLTTASGKPYVENENTMSVGARGPLLLQDFILHEKMAHFNRERIPERVVHAKERAHSAHYRYTRHLKIHQSKNIQ